MAEQGDGGGGVASGDRHATHLEKKSERGKRQPHRETEGEEVGGGFRPCGT